MSESFTYTTMKMGDDKAAAMYKMSPELASQGVPPNWMSYVQVKDAAATAKRAKELHGNVLSEPMDVMEYGKMAVIQDPQGATLGVWEPGTHKGADHFDNVGGVCWTELMTPDAKGASEFYSKLFDLKTEAMPMGEFDYTLLKRPSGGNTGGMMPMSGDEWKGIPPHWLPYVAVEDANASAAKAKELGADVKVPVTEIPNVGHFAVIADPQGAHFAILQPAPMPES